LCFFLKAGYVAFFRLQIWLLNFFFFFFLEISLSLYLSSLLIFFFFSYFFQLSCLSPFFIKKISHFVCIFSQQTTTHPHLDAQLDRQHSEKLVFVIGNGEEAGGLWVLLMVIFGLFVSRRSSWCLLVFFAHSRPNGYFWSAYFRRSVAWVFSPDLDDELDEDSA
jgi:hypothetical protein